MTKGVIFLDVAVSLAAGFLLLPIWGVNLSVAVWVGFLVLLGVVDDDRVSLSNLQRQVLFASDAQGRAKAEAAAVRRTVSWQARARRPGPAWPPIAPSSNHMLPVS